MDIHEDIERQIRIIVREEIERYHSKAIADEAMKRIKQAANIAKPPAKQ